MRKLGVLTTAVLAMAPGIAMADAYVKGSFGYGVDSSGDVRDNIARVTESGDLDVLSYSLALGQRFNPNFRGEFELNYTDIDGEDADEASASSIIGFANAYLDIPTGTLVTPYVGFGVGGGSTEVSLGDFEEDSAGFAWHVSAGASVDAGPVDLELGYRFLDAPDHGSDLVDFEYTSHQVVGAVRYNF